jgi:hypothetical protein
MQKLSEDRLLAPDAKRDLNAELLESINDLRAGKVVRVSVITRTEQVVESPLQRCEFSHT